MAYSTNSEMANQAKRVYSDYLAKQQNLKHNIFDEFAQSLKKYSPGGEGFFGAIKDYGNESGGAINDDEQFRTIDAEHAQQYKVVPKVIAWPIQFTGLVAAAQKNDKEAFANVVLDAIDSARERCLKDANRQFFGMGNGLLANPAQNTASTVTSFTVDTTQYIRANMVIDCFNGSTKTLDSRRIVDVDRANNVIYFTTSLSAELITTDAIIKENIRDSAPSDGKEMMGLRGIIDDGTDLTTLQNINASTNRIWRSVRIDGSNLNLTSDLLQRLADSVEALGGEKVDNLIMHRKQRRKYLDIVVPQKRYQDLDLDAGFDVLEFNGMKLMLAHDCQDNVVYALRKANLMKFELDPLHIGSHDGSDKYLRIANYDVFQSYWIWYCNFGTDKRNALGKIVGLNKPAGIS